MTGRAHLLSGRLSHSPLRRSEVGPGRTPLLAEAGLDGAQEMPNV